MRGIHHVGVAVRDLDEAIATYGRLFGAELEHRDTVSEQGVEAAAVVVTGFGALFWAVHLTFFVQKLHSVLLAVLASGLVVLMGVLCALAIGAWREMWRDPPPRGQEILPADYKVPYSHFHADPPEVRLAKELEERRQRLLRMRVLPGPQIVAVWLCLVHLRLALSALVKASSVSRR